MDKSTKPSSAETFDSTNNSRENPSMTSWCHSESWQRHAISVTTTARKRQSVTKSLRDYQMERQYKNSSKPKISSWTKPLPSAEAWRPQKKSCHSAEIQGQSDAVYALPVNQASVLAAVVKSMMAVARTAQRTNEHAADVERLATTV